MLQANGGNNLSLTSNNGTFAFTQTLVVVLWEDIAPCVHHLARPGDPRTRVRALAAGRDACGPGDREAAEGVDVNRWEDGSTRRTSQVGP